eukprot:s1_g2738.t1
MWSGWTRLRPRPLLQTKTSWDTKIVASARPITADTVRSREAEFLIASASRLDGIKLGPVGAHQLSDALSDNLRLWNLIVEDLLPEPGCQLSPSLCHQITALTVTVLRYTQAALETPTQSAVHVLVDLNRELAAEICAESTFGLNNRAADLGTLQDNIGLAIETLSAAASGTFDNGTNRDSFVTDYNNLLDQIDQLAADASFNGVNLLDGNSLTAKFNEDGSSSLTIAGVTFDAAGLSLTDTTTSAFGTDSGINAVVTALDSATNTLRTQSSTFGNNLAVVENRQNFTDSLISVLERGAGALTLADTNVEGANLLALQTRQSLGTTALSLSSQSDQAVLSFIR